MSTRIKNVRPDQFEASDSPQYVLRREARNHPADGEDCRRPDSRSVALRSWLVLTQIVGVAILLPWLYVLMVGVLFLDTSIYRDLVLALVYASYPILLIVSSVISWKAMKSDRLLVASVISFVPIAASLIWVWFSIYVV